MLKAINTKRYNQLAVELLKKIFNGYYEPGAKLPPTRELTKEAGVNPNTMQMALQVLQDEKILSIKIFSCLLCILQKQHRLKS